MINDYLGAWSDILFATSSTADSVIINIADLEKTISNMNLTTFNGEVVSRIILDSTTGLKVGDELLIGQEYVLIKDIESGTDIITNEVRNTASTSFRILKWVIQPDYEINLSDTLSNRVEDNELVPFTASQMPGFRYEFRLISGEVNKKNEWSFFRVQNAQLIGQPNLVSFLGADQPLFQIGDQINIQMDPFIWEYADNIFASGNVGFTSSNDHYLREGDDIFVRDQITHPQYNGPTKVREVLTSNSIRTFKSWASSTPAEAGIITYQLRPEWNKKATVVDIFQDSPNWFVVFDIDIVPGDPFYNTSDFADLNGELIDQRPNIIPNIAQSTLKRAYATDEEDMVPIVNGKLSTIINNRVPISKSGRTHLAVHVAPPLDWDFIPAFDYSFYDKSGALIGTFSQTVINNGNDYYIPVAIEDLGVTFSNIDWYSIESNTGVPLLDNYLEFDVYDCNQYSEWNLIWRDEKGSYLSYPFDLITKEATEVERSKWYKKGVGEIDFDTQSFNFYSLASNWVEEENNYLFKSMFKSPQHFLKKPDGDVIRVSMVIDQIEWGSRENDDIFQYNIIVKESKKEKRK